MTEAGSRCFWIENQYRTDRAVKAILSHFTIHLHSRLVNYGELDLPAIFASDLSCFLPVLTQYVEVRIWTGVLEEPNFNKYQVLLSDLRYIWKIDISICVRHCSTNFGTSVSIPVSVYDAFPASNIFPFGKELNMLQYRKCD